MRSRGDAESSSKGRLEGKVTATLSRVALAACGATSARPCTPWGVPVDSSRAWDRISQPATTNGTISNGKPRQSCFVTSAAPRSASHHCCESHRGAAHPRSRRPARPEGPRWPSGFASLAVVVCVSCLLPCRHEGLPGWSDCLDGHAAEARSGPGVPMACAMTVLRCGSRTGRPGPRDDEDRLTEPGPDRGLRATSSDARMCRSPRGCGPEPTARPGDESRRSV